MYALIQDIGVNGVAGLALGATIAASVKFLKNLLKIIAAVQIGIFTFLGLSGVITVNWGALWDLIAFFVHLVGNLSGITGDAESSIVNELMSLGSFGTGFATGFVLVWYYGKGFE